MTVKVHDIVDVMIVKGKSVLRSYSNYVVHVDNISVSCNSCIIVQMCAPVSSND